MKVKKRKVDNPEVVRLQQVISKQETELCETQHKLRELQRSCAHAFVPSHSGDSPSCHCKHCGTSGGWHCPQSPDGQCHYDERHGECCIHCGEPEERK
jgi:hypothetical protein